MASAYERHDYDVPTIISVMEADLQDACDAYNYASFSGADQRELDHWRRQIADIERCIQRERNGVAA